MFKHNRRSYSRTTVRLTVFTDMPTNEVVRLLEADTTGWGHVATATITETKVTRMDVRPPKPEDQNF